MCAFGALSLHACISTAGILHSDAAAKLVPLVLLWLTLQLVPRADMVGLNNIAASFLAIKSADLRVPASEQR